jgi:FkbM family methyltransferase
MAQYYLEHKSEFFQEEGHKVLLSKLKHIIPSENGKVIGIDIGCNVGNYIHNIQELCPEDNSTILLFEPNPINHPLLKANNSYTNTLLYPIALSNKEGIEPFCLYERQSYNNPGNTLACLRGGGNRICNVNVSTLDSVLESINLEEFTIKFIKIDTEGNDTNVLRGMVNNLYRTKYIIFECSDCLDDVRGPGEERPMESIVKFLDEHGFDTYRIGTKKLIQVNGKHWNNLYEQIKYHSNCFAIRKEDTLITELIDSNGVYQI